MVTQAADLGASPRARQPSPTYAPAPVRPRGWHRVYRSRRLARFLARHFHRAYYYGMADTIMNTTWLGIPLLKCPLDLWMYQEIVSEVRPAAIVETGTYRGGSALYLANVCDAVGRGKVITVDCTPTAVPEHPRITYVTGSSVERQTINRVRAAIGLARPVLVVLDSNHRRDHVLAELRSYADLVSIGSYLIVEDTNVNGHPVHARFGPGPTEAIAAFLRDDERFEIDRTREKHLVTMQPGGFLRRIR
jgi:cephalosporin hydroxylase